MLFRKALLNDKGLSLIEVLVALLVIVFSVVAIYLSLVYADSQVTRNYHERVAAFLASGELEWQYYHFKTFGDYNNFVDRQVVINAFEDSEHNTPLMGHMTMEVVNRSEIAAGRTFNYEALRIKVAWEEETLAGTTTVREVVVQEDFYR